MIKKKLKNQHYVSQMHLKKFSIPQTRQKAIQSFDLKNKVFRPSVSIKNQCSKNHFYGKSLDLEHYLASHEQACSNIMNQIIKSNSLKNLPFQDIKNLDKYMSIQLGRTPQSIENTRDMLLNFLSQAKSSGNVKNFSYFEKIVHHLINNHNYLIHESINNSLCLLPCFDDLSEVLIINQSQTDFVLSDIGIVEYNQWTKNVRGKASGGLANKGLVILFPISPKHLLVKYDSAVYAIPKLLKGNLHLQNNYQIDAINKIQCIFGERNIFFNGNEITEKSIHRISCDFKKVSTTQHKSERFLVERNEKKQLLLHVYKELPRGIPNLDWLNVRYPYRHLSPPERANNIRDAIKPFVNQLERKSSEPTYTETIAFIENIRKQSLN